MENLEIHFFHGFLGNPKDWQGVIQFLPNHWNVVCHDLITDTQDFSSEQSYFDQWTHLKTKEFSKNKKDRVLIGYSLGGRLACNLPENIYKKMILIASHPGLEENKEARLKSDQLWAEQMFHASWMEWIRAWNRQEIFKNDIKRPDRMNQIKNRDQWQKILFMFSLALQNPMDEKFKSLSFKTYWGCGEKDEVYRLIKKRLGKILKPSHLFEIKESGHGVPFDQPERLAKEIVRIVDDSE